MRVAIGADHRGFEMKELLKRRLEKLGYEVEDVGTFSRDSTDYPIYAKRVADLVLNGSVEFGILLCMSGIGMSIAANKIKGIRAAHVSGVQYARLARKHNDANIICLPAAFITDEEAVQFVVEFLTNTYEGGRHEKRLKLVKEFEG